MATITERRPGVFRPPRRPRPVTVAARLGHSPETLLRIYAQEIEHGQVDVAASLAARLDPVIQE